MSRHQADLNVTPFLDILLVMIVMFMMAIQSRQTIEAQLPDADAPVTLDAVVPIVLEVGPGRRYLLNSQPVPTVALKARLAAVFARRPDKRLLVRGAGDATYQEVVAAMDAARGAGVLALGLDRASGSANRARE